MDIRLIFRRSIANSLTILNLLLGFSSIILISLSLSGDSNYIELACIFIFIASLIDVCDGKVARKLGTSGDFGKQLDSFADIISFCLVPSFLIFYYTYNLIALQYVILISSFPLICGAIRLAKFNAYPGQSSQSYYSGLPTPANAIFICSSFLFINDLSYLVIAESAMNEFSVFNLIPWMFAKFYTTSEYTIILAPMISSVLLITGINYAKFPIIRLDSNKSNLVNIIGIIIFSVFLFVGILNKEYDIVILFFISYYIISGIIKIVISKINGEI